MGVILMNMVEILNLTRYIKSDLRVIPEVINSRVIVSLYHVDDDILYDTHHEVILNAIVAAETEMLNAIGIKEIVEPYFYALLNNDRLLKLQREIEKALSKFKEENENTDILLDNLKKVLLIENIIDYDDESSDLVHMINKRTSKETLNKISSHNSNRIY